MGIDTVEDNSMSKQSSQSSVASNDSILSTGSQGKGFEVTDAKRGIFGKQRKYNFGLKKKKNKISKDDFFNKTAEFRMWLTEEKALNLDELADAKAKELFKKFVKKWNKKSLPQKFYVGTDPLWSVASPSSYSRVAVPSDDETLQGKGESPDVSPTPSVFSTFGKKGGLRMLRKMQDKPVKEQRSPKGVPENVYDELIFGKASFQRPKSGFASPSKSVPLSQLFNNQETPVNHKQGASPVCTPVANPRPPSMDINPYSEPYSPPLPPPPPPEDLVIPGPTFVPPPPPEGIPSTQTSPIYAQINKSTSTEDSRPRTRRSISQDAVMRSRHSMVDSPSLRMPPPPPPPPRSRSMQFDNGTFTLPNDRPLTRSRSRESICSISSVASEPAYNMGGRVSRNSSRRRPPPPPPKRTDSLRSVNSDSSYYKRPPMPTPSHFKSGSITRSRSRESLASVTSDLGSSLAFSDRNSARYGSQMSMQSAMSVSSQNSQVLPDAGSPAKLPKKGPPRKGQAPAPPPFASTKDIKGYASIKKKRPSIHLAKSLEDISTKVLSAANTTATKEDIKKFKRDGRFDVSSTWTKPILV